MGTGRRRWARGLAVLAAVFWGFFWFGLIDLLVVVDQDEQFYEHYLFESGWGLLYLVLLTVPFCVLVARPGDRVALWQTGLCSVAVLVGGVWGWAWPQLLNGLALAVTVVLLAWVAGAGRGAWALPRRPDPVVLVLAVAALPAAIAYGHPLARNTTAVEDITNGVSHYPMQASLGLALVAVSALAAWTRSRLASLTVAFSAVWLGVESIVYPDLGASLGVVGGALAAVWGLLVAVAVEVARRRTPAGAAVSTPAAP